MSYQIYAKILENFFHKLLNNFKEDRKHKDTNNIDKFKFKYLKKVVLSKHLLQNYNTNYLCKVIFYLQGKYLYQIN